MGNNGRQISIKHNKIIAECLIINCIKFQSSTFLFNCIYSVYNLVPLRI